MEGLKRRGRSEGLKGQKAPPQKKGGKKVPGTTKKKSKNPNAKTVHGGKDSVASGLYDQLRG